MFLVCILVLAQALSEISAFGAVKGDVLSHSPN